MGTAKANQHTHQLLNHASQSLKMYYLNLSRYLMASAQAQIDGYRTGYPEFLNVTYEHPDFSYNVSHA